VAYRYFTELGRRICLHTCQAKLSDPELVESNPGKPESYPTSRPAFQNYLTVPPAKVSMYLRCDYCERRTGTIDSAEIPDTGGTPRPRNLRPSPNSSQ